MPRRIRLVTEGRSEPAWLDTEISRTMLAAASSGDLAETVRIHVPARVVAFGKRDVIDRRYQAAVTAATGAGFAAVERMAGGRAAVFTEHTLSFAWTIPDPDPRAGVTARFTAIAELVVEAFAILGVGAAVGEIPGEYCPGTWSVHHEGRIKLMGVGQRLARHAAHVGGVIVVDRSDLVRRALVPVYDALAIPWDPTTAGSLGDVAPGVTVESARDALVAAFGDRFILEPAGLDDATVASALTAAG